MRYQRVVWHHDQEDDPVVLWSEITDDGWERRKVDEYRDGRRAYADAETSMGATWLSDQPMATLDEINAQGEFVACRISRAEFDAAWQRAVRR